MRTLRTGLWLSLVLALVLAGCGGNGETQVQSGQQTGDGGEISGDLTVWAMGAEGENLPELAKQFEQEHGGITVKVVPVPWETAHDKLLTSVAGQQTPDISQMGTTWMGEFAETGALAEVPEGTVDQTAFYESAWSTVVVDDTSFGVPWYVDTRVMFYRTDLAKKAGWDEAPATWDELKQFARDLKEKAGARYGINLSPANWQELMPFIWQTGTEVWDGEQFHFDTEGVVEALAYYDSFFEEGLAAEPVPNFDVTQGFISGTHPLFFSGPWHVGIIQDQGGKEMEGKWDVALMPEKETRTSFVGGSDLVVFQNSDQQEAAWEFVSWLSQPAQQSEWFQITGDLPAVREAWESGDLAQNENLATFGEQMDMTKAPPSIPMWEEVAVSAINTEMEKVTIGGATPEEAAEAMQQQAEGIGS